MYLMNLPFIALLVFYPPLATPLMNRLEIYNEMIILICTCMLIGFTDYPEKKLGEGFGWAFIGLASSIIGVTLLVILYQILSVLYRKLEERRIRIKHEKQIYPI
jgi:hypothetical protein